MQIGLLLLVVAAVLLVPPLWAAGVMFTLPPLVGLVAAIAGLVCVRRWRGDEYTEPLVRALRLRAGLSLVAAAIAVCHVALCLRVVVVTRIIALSEVSQSNLRGIGQQLRAYYDNFGQYPETVSALITAGFSTEGQWISPGDGYAVETMVLSEGYSSYAYSPGRGEWSSDPELLLAYERGPWTYGQWDLACNPGYSVLRGDLSVEWLDVGAFDEGRRRDRAARERLGWLEEARVSDE